MTLPTTLPELTALLDAKRLELHKIFEEAGDDLDLSKVESFKGMDAQGRVTEVRKRNEELGEIQKAREPLIELDAIRQHARAVDDDLGRPKNAPPHLRIPDGAAVEPKQRSIRQMLEESKDYGALRKARGGTAMLELTEAETKTLFTLTSMPTPATRLPTIVPFPFETASVRDLLLAGTIDNTSLTYLEETTSTNAAATVAEGGTKPESAIAFTERQEAVRKIATWLPVTDEVLADLSVAQSYIEGRLVFFVRRVDEQQILTGDGVAPNLLGLHNRTGVQTQAKGADPVPDAVYKGMVLVMTNAFSDPTGIVMHPLDWQDVRLLRTADGVYIWGSPADVGPERMWGLPVRITTAEPQNTALIVSRPMAQVFQREGVQITMSTEHSTFFIENKVAILAEERLALAVYRPAAFCKVTGI